MKADAENGQAEDGAGHIEAEDDDDDQEWEGFDEDQDVVDCNDEAYMSVLSKLSAGGVGGDMAQFLVGGDWDDLDDEDDFHSPIDNIDELHFVNDILKEAYAREPEIYQQVQAALPPEVVAS